MAADALEGDTETITPAPLGVDPDLAAQLLRSFLADDYDAMTRLLEGLKIGEIMDLRSEFLDVALYLRNHELRQM
jgi:hypothetical protein